MGRAQLRQGGMVTANSTLLTTVYETDRMYVNFSISEQRLLSVAAPPRTRAQPGREYTAAVSTVSWPTARDYPQIPRLNFIDPAVDTRTGTLAIRLEVDNPQHLLHAGQFARVQVTPQQDPNAIVLPQRAIQDLQGKNYVWIVDADGKAQQRDVHMGLRIGGDWQVQQGLKAGETVIVDGVQRLKPGMPVKATPLARQHRRHGPRPGLPAAAARQVMRRGAGMIDFFIDRPIFSTVLAIIITIAGAVSLSALPIARYPQITPPTIVVSTAFPAPTPPPSSSRSRRRSSSRSTACRT